MKYKNFNSFQKMLFWSFMVTVTLLGLKLTGVDVRVDFTLMLVGLGIVVSGVLWGDKL